MFKLIRRVDEFACVIYAQMVGWSHAKLDRPLTNVELRALAREAYNAAHHLEDEARKRDGEGSTL